MSTCVYDLSLTQNIASPIENQRMGTKGKGGGGMGWEIGIGICTLILHIKSLTNENLPDSTRNFTRCSVVN